MDIEPTNFDLALLRKRIENEIETYHYDLPSNAIGNPWTDEAVRKA